MDNVIMWVVIGLISIINFVYVMKLRRRIMTYSRAFAVLQYWWDCTPEGAKVRADGGKGPFQYLRATLPWIFTEVI